MSYIQITNRCNMKCKHCCFSCTSVGHDMTMFVYEKALEYCQERGDETIAIGGGEPTIHPMFDEFLMKALYKFDYVWMATNGKDTEKVLDLISLAKKYDGFTLAISQDVFHEPIDNEILKKVEYVNKHFKNKIEIRNINKLLNHGRAKNLDSFYYEKNEDCCCPDLFINPYGEVKWCGCDEAKIITNVTYPREYIVECDLINLYGECFKTSEEYKEFCKNESSFKLCK